MSLAHRFAVRAGVLLLIALLVPALTAARGADSHIVFASLRPDVAVNSTCATTTTLYDGALGGTPDTQGMLYQALATATTQIFSNGATTLDTTARQADLAGYFGKSTAVPVLDRTKGYSITFDVQMLSEAHSRTNRAGLSLIALSSDTQGIELGFWADHIWAQEDGVAEPPDGTLFTHAEDVAFNTTAGRISYTLAIHGSSYSLAAGGASILTGSLRDYRAASGPNPYSTPNFIFLGDDTSSARAKIRLVSLTIATTTACLNYRYLPLVISAKSS
jgi:hypothetical protein